MPHQTPLIATIVIGIVLAFVLGAVANRFRVSPIVGYVLAGVMVGPHTPGFVADQALARELAEIGVILLMFGVGLHFSLKELLAVRAIAIPGALLGILTGTLLGLIAGVAMGWSAGAGLVFGISLSVASTVVLVRALQDRRQLKSEPGRIAVGWLVVEDLVMILALVLMPALAAFGRPEDRASGMVEVPGLSVGEVALALALTVGKILAFIVATLVIGRRLVPWALHRIAKSGSRELFRLAVLTIALGIAFGAAALFDVSFALGAFLAGMILSESELSQRAAEETMPLRDAFAVLFFVSVGMLIDPTIIVRDPGPVLATIAIILLGKPVVAFFMVRLLGRSPRTALTIAASVAQIGEFSFIFVGLAVALGLLPAEGRDYVLAGAIVTILLNPLVLFGADRFSPTLDRWLGETKASPAGAGSVADGLTPTSLVDHAIIVGGGRVGRLIADDLVKRGTPFLIVEDRPEVAEAFAARGIEVVNGNAVDSDVMRAANTGRARHLFVAIPNAFEAGQILAGAVSANPQLRIHARAHSDEEVEHLRAHGAHVIIMGEAEIARGMLLAAFPGKSDQI